MRGNVDWLSAAIADDSLVAVSDGFTVVDFTSPTYVWHGALSLRFGSGALPGPPTDAVQTKCTPHSSQQCQGLDQGLLAEPNLTLKTCIGSCPKNHFTNL